MIDCPKILVVGSLNMDLVFTTERFPQVGETVMGSSFNTAIGGKGSNQAVQAARLGAKVTMVGKVGRDSYGETIVNAVSNEGVDTRNVFVSESAPTAVVDIQIEKNENRTNNRICVVPGANMDITFDDIAFLKEDIKAYDMVMLQLEIPMEINLAVARFAKAKGIPVMLNSAPYAPLPDELLQLITYISPNEHEAAEIAKMQVCDVKTAELAARKIMSLGVSNVIITLGKAGAVLVDENEMVFSPAVEGVTAVDPTAAGDSFVSAFCTAICSGLDKKKAMEFANNTAAITVTRLGAMPSLPTIDEVYNAYKKRGLKWK